MEKLYRLKPLEWIKHHEYTDIIDAGITTNGFCRYITFSKEVCIFIGYNYELQCFVEPGCLESSFMMTFQTLEELKIGADKWYEEWMSQNLIQEVNIK